MRSKTPNPGGASRTNSKSRSKTPVQNAAPDDLLSGGSAEATQDSPSAQVNCDIGKGWWLTYNTKRQGGADFRLILTEKTKTSTTVVTITVKKQGTTYSFFYNDKKIDVRFPILTVPTGLPPMLFKKVKSVYILAGPLHTDLPVFFE